MKPSQWISVLFCFVGLSKMATAAVAQLKIEHLVEYAQEPLSVELVWKLDPLDWNPSRRHWLLDREVSLLGLQVVEGSKAGTFVPEVLGGIKAMTRVYIKGPGPWFQKKDQPLCPGYPRDWYSTEESSLWISEKAAAFWRKILEKEIAGFERRLSKISDPSSSRARQLARIAFGQWLYDVEQKWIKWKQGEAPKLEWQYESKSFEKGVPCVKPEPWTDQMAPIEEPSSEPGKPAFDFLRVPIKKFGMVPTFRGSMDIGERRLNGRFSIDTTTPRSYFSPLWLRRQGIEPEIFKLRAYPESFQWRRRWVKTFSVAPDRVQISGLSVFLPRVSLVDTSSIFKTSVQHGNRDWMDNSFCCDGVLGLDFLRQLSVEWNQQTPAHLKVWKRDLYRRPASADGIEVFTDQAGKLATHCFAGVVGSGTDVEARYPVEVEFDLASERPMEVLSSSVLAKKSQKKKNSTWQVQCGNTILIPALTRSLPPRSMRVTLHTLSGKPAFSLDLGRGMLWLYKNAL